MQHTLFDAIPARATDPDTSTHAATRTRQYNGQLVAAIRTACTQAGQPLTQQQIAAAVEQTHGTRWKTGTIITACARAGLRRIGTVVVDGRPLSTWTCA